jgi:hypothetical protein
MYIFPILFNPKIARKWVINTYKGSDVVNSKLVQLNIVKLQIHYVSQCTKVCFSQIVWFKAIYKLILMYCEILLNSGQSNNCMSFPRIELEPVLNWYVEFHKMAWIADLFWFDGYFYLLKLIFLNVSLSYNLIFVQSWELEVVRVADRPIENVLVTQTLQHKLYVWVTSYLLSVWADTACK